MIRTAVAAVLLAGVLPAGLAGCAGDEALHGFTPPQTSVPEVAEGDFPTLGTRQEPGRTPLTPEAQQKLQRDLERLARTQSN